MLERDREPLHANSVQAMSPPSSPPPSSSLFCNPSSSLDSRSFPVFNGKAQRSESLESADAMATRGASLVAQEEPEQELSLQYENKTLGAFKTDIHVIKRRNVGVPKFLRFLFQILEVEDPAIITWSHDGTAFQIMQPEELANQILPKYFKHNKVSSFQRQLNYFGFKKWTKTQTNTCTFSHPFFLQANKERMKLIKRKERANPAVMSAAMAAAISSNPIHLMNQMQLREREQAQTQFEARDLAQVRSQLPTQQALKRQKSNTLSGATVTFLNSVASGRRHSTGMLPGSEAFGLAAAAAAAAASESGRKRVGTPAEQEFELEMEAQSANATSTQQQMQYLRKIAETREVAQRYPYQSARGKRQSLPHVLPPGMGDSMSMGIAMNLSNNGGNNGYTPRSGVYLGRRRSDQLFPDFNIGTKAPTSTQLEDFMASSANSQQTIFTSSMKNDASVVLPISSVSLAQDSYQLHQQRQQQRQQQLRQQMSRQQNNFGGSGYGSLKSSSGWSSIKAEACSGWPTSLNVNSSAATSASYPPPQQNHSMTPFKFGDSNTVQNSMLSYQGGGGSMSYSQTSSNSEQKPQQRPLMSQSQMYQSQEQRIPSYQQRHQEEPAESNLQQPRDYIDVLLESAELDETSTTLPSESWTESSFIHPQQGQNGSGSYSFMQSQQQSHQELQLSSMGMAPNPNQRF